MHLASLPWYDLDEVRPATDAFWRRLARNLREQGFTGVPDNLNRSMTLSSQWTERSLLFSQACGYDVVFSHKRYLQVVAAPRYRADGCQGSRYSSKILVREDAPYQKLDDLRGTRCVINQPSSHSGMNILRLMFARLQRGGKFFEHVSYSGSHVRSLGKVVRGHADVMAIDSVLHAHLEIHRPLLLHGLRVLCLTRQAPAPPFVTSTSVSRDGLIRVRAALQATLSDPDMQWAMAELLLDGADELTLQDYQPILHMERSGRDLGFDETDASSA